jgi:hypothetical protein
VRGGIGFAAALFLLFLGLKLGHAIAWSWWWVTAPLWIPGGIAVLILVGIFFGLIGAAIMQENDKCKRADALFKARAAARGDHIV